MVYVIDYWFGSEYCYGMVLYDCCNEKNESEEQV
jgi:hypothetical protein